MRSPTTRSLIFLEGPDSTGKTTLCNQLQDKTNEFIACHHGPYSNLSSNVLSRMYLETMLPAQWGFTNVVMDRCWISEWVYGPLLRNGSRLNEVDRFILETTAFRCGAVVVWTTPPVERASELYAASDDNRWDSDQYLELIESYKKQTYNVFLPQVFYDWTQPDAFDKLITKISDAMPYSHPVEACSAGSREAPVIVSFDPRHHSDLLRDTTLSMARLPFLNNTTLDRAIIMKPLEIGVRSNGIFWLPLTEEGVIQVNASMHPSPVVVSIDNGHIDADSSKIPPLFIGSSNPWEDNYQIDNFVGDIKRAMEFQQKAADKQETSQ